LVSAIEFIPATDELVPRPPWPRSSGLRLLSPGPTVSSRKTRICVNKTVRLA